MLAERAILPNEITESVAITEEQLIQPLSKLKVKKKWKYKSKFMKYSFLLLLYAGLLVVLQLKGSMLSYEITNLKQDISSLQTANYRFEYQIQQLSSLDRIESIAIQELHMVKPEWNNAYTVARMAIPPIQAEDSLLTDTVIAEPEKPMARIYNSLLALRQP